MAGVMSRAIMAPPLMNFQTVQFYNMIPEDIKLEELIGSGSFSYVFRATDTKTKETLAIKCIRAKMLSITHYRYVAKEIAFMKIFEHPNILRVKIYEIMKNFVYIGTDYATHGSLKNYLQEFGPITESKTQFIMKQLLSALDYMHSMGIFHGDIKPDNVLLTDMNENGPIIKICDFGLTEIKLKGLGNMFFKSGSFFYMAPEVHLGYPVDCSCDLWSAGLIMYRMMFARKLFCTSDKDRRKFVFCIKKRITPNFYGSEAFSMNCIDLLKSLLSYDKQNRYTGKILRDHPFLELQDPPVHGARFIMEAQEKITSAFAAANLNKYGAALIDATQAVIEMKIYHNIIDNEVGQQYLRRKWEQYQNFCCGMERVLLLPDEIELFCPEYVGDRQFRQYLASTPQLLDGFDIGCNAEVYMREGHKHKALEKFHQSLQILLPCMKWEPRGNRKNILGHRIKKWIKDLEGLQQELAQVPNAAVANVAAANAAAANAAVANVAAANVAAANAAVANVAADDVAAANLAIAKNN